MRRRLRAAAAAAAAAQCAATLRPARPAAPSPLSRGAGFYKFVVRTRENVTIMQWHGHLGLATWALALLNICVAVYGYFYASRPWLAYVVWAGLAGVLLSSVLTVLFDPDRSAAAQAEGYDNNDGGGRYGKFDDETLIGSLYNDQSPARGGSMNSGMI